MPWQRIVQGTDQGLAIENQNPGNFNALAR
jgi:hypothetical protein